MGKTLYQIAVANGYIGTERDFWLSLRTKTSPETDPLFTAWLAATPPVMYPAGNDTEIQFNDGGIFGADTDFTYDKTLKELGLKNAVLKSSATDRQLTIRNNVQVPSGVSQAISLDAGKYVSLPTSITDFNYTDSHSYSAWIWVDPTAPSINLWIINNGDSYNGTSLVMWGGKIGFFYQGGNAVVVSNSSIPINQWVLVEVAYNSVGQTVEFYMNGVADGNTTAGWVNNVATTTPLIGRWFNGSYEFKGFIDEVRIYNKAITAQEAAEHYNSGNGQYGVPETGLVAGYHLDGDVVDYSGNNHAGTEQGSPTYVAGKVPAMAVDNDTEIIIHKNSARSGSKGDMNIAPEPETYVGIGVDEPKSKVDIDGSIKIGDDADTASADKAGTLRYYTDSNNSYLDMCMQTGASTYAWVNLKTNTW